MGKGDYIKSHGPSNAKLLILAEAPGEQEEIQGRNLVGPTGKMVNDMLGLAGTNLDETFRANVVRHRPPYNQLAKLKEIGHSIEEYIPAVWNEIEAINPNCILTLGRLPLQVLCGKDGILKWRGSILQTQSYKGKRWKVVPTIHPAALFPRRGETKGPIPFSAKTYITLDIKRAVNESQSPNYDPPKRTLVICRSSMQFYNMLKEFSDVKLWASDIEAKNCIPTCISLAPNPQYAMCIPIMPISTERIAEHEIVERLNLLDKFFQSGIKLIGQNFIMYDKDKLLTCLRMNVPEIYADTQVLSRALYPELPATLQFQTSVHTKEPFYKDEGKEFNEAKDPVEQYYIYNCKDSAVCYECYLKEDHLLRKYGLEDFAYNYLMKMIPIYAKMAREGFEMDLPVLKELYVKYDSRELEINENLFGLLGYYFNTGSPQQCKKVLFDDLGLPRRLSTNEDTLVALMANHTQKDLRKRLVLDNIIDSRKVKKTKNTYILAIPDFDGKMRSAWNAVGAETGRTTTGKMKPPIRPHWIDKKKKKKRPIGMGYHVLTKHGKIGPDIRRAYRADKDHVIMEFDFAQAEMRVASRLANDSDTLELFESLDLHRVTAALFYTKDLDRYTAASLNAEVKRNPSKFNPIIEKISSSQRQVGKTGRYLGQYGGAKRRLMMTLMTDSRKYDLKLYISEKEAGEVLEKFHAFTPKIQKVFHREIREYLAANKRVLYNAFGRRRQFMGRWEEDLFREAFAYMGQSTVKDHMGHILLRIDSERPDIRIMSENHDAWVLMVPKTAIAETAEFMREVMQVPIDFSRCSLPREPLTIPVDAKIGENYKEMETYDF